MTNGALMVLVGLGALFFGGGQGAARSLALKVAADITKRKYDYSRAQLKAFQRAAGVAADGIYGPDTQKALARYTTAPKALFVGAGARAKKAA